MKIAIALISLFTLSYASTSEASPCTEVKRRIGERQVFTSPGLGWGSSSRIELKKAGSSWNRATYEIDSGSERGRMEIVDHGLLCTVNSIDDVHFSREVSFVLTLPNAKGECRIMGIKASRLVNESDKERFIKGGFCAYPLSLNPAIAILGTSGYAPQEASAE